MKAATFDEGFKVEKPVILLYLLPMLGKGTFFSSCFGSRSHVIKTCEETVRLSCDDGWMDLGFIFVEIWNLFGFLVHGFLLGLVPG